jgi:hypothetical protein
MAVLLFGIEFCGDWTRTALEIEISLPIFICILCMCIHIPRLSISKLCTSTLDASANRVMARTQL